MTHSSIQTTQLKRVEYVHYHVSNRLLIIAEETQFNGIWEKLSADFKITWLTRNEPGVRFKYVLMAKGVEILPESGTPRLKGYLGNFSISTDSHSMFDLVLDFQHQAVIDYSIPPFGYYHLGDSPETVSTVLDELKTMVGVFDKPRYFQLESGKCAHQQNGIKGCNRCLDACATSAISTESGLIQINPYLCQGCGDCATVCPSGAINYQYPDRIQALLNIRQVLSEQTGVLLIYSGYKPELPVCADVPFVFYEVEALGSTGMDIWLTALAYGAHQVWLQENTDLTMETRQVLSQQMEQANDLLTGMGYPVQLIQWAKVGGFEYLTNRSDIRKANFYPDGDKRTAIRMAVDHLLHESGSLVESCYFSNPGDFGTVELNQRDCTLCMACVTVCPSRALSSGTGYPQLKFIESDCVQCGICQDACPEKAVSLTSRYLYDSSEARKIRLLYEQEPFCCILCKKPFASKSMIHTILEKLQDHPMFTGEKRRQIMMCEDCKVNSMFDR